MRQGREGRQTEGEFSRKLLLLATGVYSNWKILGAKVEHAPQM